MIKIENISERRNELLAEMFHLVHFVERWGRGIGLMISKEPEVNFKEVGRQFITVFKRKNVVSGAREKTTQKILSLIKENPKITGRELVGFLNITTDGVKYHINNLNKKGLIKRIGGRKEGSWKIIKKFKI